MPSLPKVDDLLVMDMHVHVGPEYLQRRYTAQALMEEGRREGFGAVMKNHFQPTTAWVSQAMRAGDKVKFAAAIVRMLKALAENDLTLATGHLNAQETVLLVKRAHAAGIRRIVMTHPLFQATNQALDALVTMWRDYGAYSELAFVNIAMDHLSYESYVDVMRAVGPEGVVLTTDLGQVMNMKVADGWREYMAELKKRGVKEDEIARMAVLNPHRVLYASELAARS